MRWQQQDRPPQLVQMDMPTAVSLASISDAFRSLHVTIFVPELRSQADVVHFSFCHFTYFLLL